MEVIDTNLPEIKIITLSVFRDERGQFMETFNLREFENKIGVSPKFIQTNESLSNINVLRGLHYQVEKPQSKLIKCIVGHITDIVVDVRKGSPTFGQHVSVELSQMGSESLWVPKGFAHGFYTRTPVALVSYMVDEYRYPEYERVLRYDDISLDLNWGLLFPESLPVLSDRDKHGQSLLDIELIGVTS
jgi:dTDP-4-dehydrorhamnose 3,5-epimerase